MITLDSYGQTYRQDFDSLGGLGSLLPVGWEARSKDILGRVGDIAIYSQESNPTT